MSEEIRMKFGESEVVYNVRNQTWTFEGVSEATMMKIAPEKVTLINATLAKDISEYQERIAKEEAEKKAQITATRQVVIDAFKTEVEPLLPVGFTTRFASTDSPYSSIILSELQWVRIQKDTVDATISFQDRIYRRSSSYNHTTSAPWLVEFDYKNSRYATLDKAIKSVCKKIDGKIAEQARKETIKETAQKVTQDQTTYLAERGIQLVIETKYEEGRRGIRNGSSYEVKKARIVVSDPTPEAKYGRKMVVVSGNLLSRENSYEVRHLIISGSFTLEQFKKVADAVKEIAPEPASNY